MRVILVIIVVFNLFGNSLKMEYQKALPEGDFDKVLHLESGKIYIGGLYLGGVYNFMTLQYEYGSNDKVLIEGNGAVIDLMGEEISIAYCEGSLNVENCVILNGNIRYSGATDDIGNHIQPSGSVSNVTFYEPHDYGVRIYRSGTDIFVSKNIIIDPINTGNDFHHLNSNPMYWLPTGFSIDRSIFPQYGQPWITENVSFFSNPIFNYENINHYVMMCDEG
ncbi:MAG: hypothetical protein JXR48_08000 [Candidatus Delongbacteria bacterium]|nr:hypothetical protein [Candidatus Delongbacteria bacterium]MBN2834895.1 hypothetical protein [Candidatus Delongbacteria bacterium]